MRKHLVLLVGLAMMAMLPAQALAGVVGTVHDLPQFLGYTGATARMGTCSFCHIPHKAAAGGDKLFPSTYASGLPAPWNAAPIDTLSNVCWFCHGVSGVGSAQEVNPFQAANHKRNTSLLTTGINANSIDPGDIASVPTDMNLTGTGLRCVSCHKIHDNTVKPFLQWGTNGNFSAAAGGFCAKCHPNRSNTNATGTGSAGNHYSNTAFADTLGLGSPVTGAALPAITNVPMVAGVNAGAWNLGGHSLNTVMGTGTTTFVCGSCHAVHSNESTTFDSTTDGGNVVGAAVTAAGNPVLVASEQSSGTGATDAEAICLACHSVALGYEQRGPGATNTYSHPVGLASTTATTMRATLPAGLQAGPQKWGSNGTNYRIICQSCHDIHWSGTNHTSGTPTSTSAYLLAFQCTECHGAGPSIANHHPSNVTVTKGTTVQTQPAVSSATDWVARTQTATSTLYFPGSDVLMDCGTCHATALKGAHNNATGFPALIGDITDSGMCVDCHGFNPSPYTGHSTTGLSTHYVGSINNAGTAYKKTDVFNSLGASQVAKWSVDGTNGSVICESCHTLKINGHNGHAITNQSSNNVGDGIASTDDNITLLLLTSGNSVGGFTAAQNLCTACHGGAPGGGLTHPTLPAYTNNSTMTTTLPATTTNGSAVGQINCESCHRPHDAATGSQSADWSVSWMLEAGTYNAGSNYYDYSPTCGLCHTGQY